MERQLLEACKTGDLPNVKKLCRVVDASKVRDLFGFTPLHWAAWYVKHGLTQTIDLVYNDNVLHRKRPKCNNELTLHLCDLDSHNYVFELSLHTTYISNDQRSSL